MPGSRLPSGREVGIVDVPGHERFVKNMLAGVGGIDLALLMVAANEGVMPQTREHLAILDIIGVRRGVVAITKKDLVDEELLTLVRMEVEELIATTTIAGAPVVAVSSVTREGLPELLAAIDQQLDQHRAEKRFGPAPPPRRPDFYHRRRRHGGHRHAHRRHADGGAGGGDCPFRPEIAHPRPADAQGKGQYRHPRQPGGGEPGGDEY